MLICFSHEIYAENDAVAQTQETKVVCMIDGLFIESYAVDDFMYLPVEKLQEYGFDINRNADSIELVRKKTVYFDGCYDEKKTSGGLPVYENVIPVTIDGKFANTYVIGDRVVIQADELSAFGDFTWNEETQTIVISIIANELMNAFENAEDKVTVEEGTTYISGQQKNGVWNGIVKTSVFQGMTNYGYMKDGKYEGVVFGYREHKPYLAALYELKTMRNGMKNGYCRYETGYNNKPEPPQTIKNASGIYENDKLKNGEYTIYTDYDWNTSTYVVEEFKEQIISSTRNWYTYEKSLSEVFYHGELVDFDVAPVMEDDRTLIPLRGLFERMGASVEWDGEKQTATVIMDDTVLSVKIDHYKAKINDSFKYMDIPTRLVEGRTMIPLRFLSEELGYVVIWHSEDNCIYISEEIHYR